MVNIIMVYTVLPQAAMVTGLPVTDVTTATESVKALQETGTRCVVLTLGEKGLLYTQLVMGKWTPILHIAAEKVDVVDTTVRSCCHCSSKIMSTFNALCFSKTMVAAYVHLIHKFMICGQYSAVLEQV